MVGIIIHKFKYVDSYTLVLNFFECRRVQESAGECRRVQKGAGECSRVQENAGDYSET